MKKKIFFHKKRSGEKFMVNLYPVGEFFFCSLLVIVFFYYRKLRDYYNLYGTEDHDHFPNLKVYINFAVVSSIINFVIMYFFHYWKKRKLETPEIFVYISIFLNILMLIVLKYKEKRMPQENDFPYMLEKLDKQSEDTE